MENKLEQSLMYASRNFLTERVYSVVDLESLGASALYSKESEKEIYEKYIDETFREDSPHKGTNYEHINWQTWLNLEGDKEGRKKELSNSHIFIAPPSRGNGY